MAEARKRRKSDGARQANQVIRSRTAWLMLIFGVGTFLLLFWKLFDLQILRHEELESKAVSQQTRSSVITASRGTIYDRSGEVLAISTTAETVNISPKDIASYVKDQETAIEEARAKAAEKGESYTAPEVKDEDYIARGLARILGVEEETIRQRMEKLNSGYEIIKKKAPQAEADEVRRFVNGEIDDEGNEVPEKERKKLHGVYLEPDSKRYYPNGTLAAQVIGFVNADNDGAYGLESYYNSALTGTSGMTVTAKNAAGKTMLYDYEQYYDAENGANLVTTLDSTVQYYLEKGLEEMIAKFDPKNGATGIVMDVRNGAVLGMASFPTYDLNNYSGIYDSKLQETLAGLEEGSDEYLSALGAAQNKQWRNKCVNDTYEPGSTFKPVTLAAALEEGLVNPNTTFNCTGSIRVPGWSGAIGCSKRSGHGTQVLKVATGNSCNPAFITMGLKIGTETYYDYLEKFGFLESTGIDLYGESKTIFASRENFNTNVVSLASYAFGQTFNITPLHLIRAQAACVNGGYLYEPYLVEQIVDDDGAVLYQHDATPIRQVISEETSATVRECLEYVVAQGTGRWWATASAARPAPPTRPGAARRTIPGATWWSPSCASPRRTIPSTSFLSPWIPPAGIPASTSPAATWPPPPRARSWARSCPIWGWSPSTARTISPPWTRACPTAWVSRRRRPRRSSPSGASPAGPWAAATPSPTRPRQAGLSSPAAPPSSSTWGRRSQTPPSPSPMWWGSRRRRPISGSPRRALS